MSRSLEAIAPLTLASRSRDSAVSVRFRGAAPPLATVPPCDQKAEQHVHPTESGDEDRIPPRERAEERRQGQLEERRRLKAEERVRARKAAWESFMRRERRELKLRKEGQLAELLGEALAGEPPAALRRLALEDQRQAEEGLVALTSNGKTYYKLVEELTEGDMGARIAADRLRKAWLKERRDRWLGRREDSGQGTL